MRNSLPTFPTARWCSSRLSTATTARSMFTNTRRARVSNDRPALHGQGSRHIGVALFLFRATFSFSQHRPSTRLAKPKKRKNSSRVCMYARIDELIYFFLFFFYFFFIKRKVSEEMPFNSEVWERNSNNFRKNVNYFGRNSNNFGRYKDKWVRNFARKTAENAPKSACFLTLKIIVFSLVAQ